MLASTTLMLVLFILGMILGFVLLFAGIWCGVCWLIGQFGGWGRLARHYATTQAPENDLHRAQTAEFGVMRYRNCLTVGISPRGLYLAVWPLLRIGHPDLLIPWEQTTPAREVTGFFRHFAEVSVGTPRLAVIRLPVHLLEPIRQMQQNAGLTG